MKKKVIMMLLTGIMAVSMSACSSQEEPSDDVQQAVQDEETQENGEEQSENVSEGNAEMAERGSNILVAYFTYAENAELPDGIDASASASIQEGSSGITGNTGIAASMISEALGADLFSIQTVEQYPGSYDDTIDQGQEEQSEGARPELASEIEDISHYDTVFLGYPNWWGDMPMAVYSFLDEYDLSGKTVIPFVTSGGSGFSATVSAIESAEPDADVQEGIAIRDSDTMDAQAEINAWLDGLGY